MSGIARQRPAARRAVTTAIQTLRGLIGHAGSAEEVRADMDKLEDKMRRLQVLDDIFMSSVDDGSYDDEYDKVESYRDGAVEALSLARSYLISLSTPTTTATTPVTSSISLPKLELPKFSGVYLEWRSFWSQFDAAVHASSIPDAQKFAHLRACLRGSAADAISGMALTSGNYAMAVKHLQERFGDPNLLIGLYAEKLVASKKAEEEDPRSFRRVVDEFECSLREVEQIVTEVTASSGSMSPRQLQNLMLAPILLRKLPKAVKIEWARRQSSPVDRFDLDKLRVFIHSEVETMEAMAAESNDDKGPYGKSRTSSAFTATANDGRARDYKSISDLPPMDRFAEARKRRLCFNCLSGHHLQRDCESTNTCRSCGGRHHSCLHDCYSRKTDETSLSGRTATRNVGTILQTAVAQVKLPNGHTHAVRILLDGGSEQSYVTKRLCRLGGLKVVAESSFAIEGFGSETTSNQVRQQVCVSLLSRFSQKTFTAKLWSVERICNPLKAYPERRQLPSVFRNLKLAETFDHDVMEVDILLGADCFAAAFEDKPSIRQGGLKAWDTVFGWVIAGKANNSLPSSPNPRSMFVGGSDFTRLWSLETIGVDKGDLGNPDFPLPDWDGERYQVQLPWIDSTRPRISFKQAKLRNRHFDKLPLERQLKYRQVLQEWEDRRIIEHSDSFGGSFIPHHSVVQGQKKLRVVLDGACKGSESPSINECLSPGPKLSLNLVAVLIRFRFFRYAFATDIEKAYLMIGIQSEDRQFLKVLHPDGKVLRFARLPFGLNCSAGLLHSSIQHHLQRTNADNRLVEGLYVDDLLTGADSIEELSSLFNMAKVSFSSAGMNLHKMSTSASSIRESFGEGSESTKVLGVGWNTESDNLSVSMAVVIGIDIRTKRDVLSACARVFDPLGMMSPLTVRLKLLVRDSWLCPGGLDEPVDQTIVEKWNAFKEECRSSPAIAFRRHLEVTESSFLQCFADASKNAYSACVYLGSDDSQRLVYSRSRVSPLKPETLTIPRLELMAALLAIRIYKMLCECSGGLKELKVKFFTDSMVVLGWIRGISTDVFVRNRVKEILGSSEPSDWHHIGTASNPADIPSRGCSVEALAQSTLWWHGPSNSNSCSDSCPACGPSSTLSATVSAVVTEERRSFLPIGRWSSWIKCVRIVAWIRRYIHNSRSECRASGALSLRELADSKCSLILDSQMDVDIKSISPKLHPKYDVDGLIRCYPRTGEEPLFFLSSSSGIVPLLVRYVHCEVLYHQGRNSTSEEIRRSFIIPGLREVVRNVINKCVRCRKVQGRRFVAPEGLLPSYRTTPSRPFANTGIDHAGPFELRDGGKIWILLFTCAAVRAVHFEAVSGLSEEETSLALRRFMALYGQCRIYSDNGSSFKALQSRLQGLVDWKTIPEASPWWGGFWERMVGTMKRSLKATLGSAPMNLVEYRTVLMELGERINRRPLCAGSDQDSALTPAHFLHGCSPPGLMQAASDMEEEDREKLGSRWRHRLMVSSHLWKRWRLEYLSTLRSWRRGNPRTSREPMEGEIVLVISKLQSRSSWPLAVVSRLLRGRDNIVRAVEVILNGRCTRRAVDNLVPLEVSKMAPNLRGGVCEEPSP